MGNEYLQEDSLEIYTPDMGDSKEIGIDQTTTSYSPRLNSLKEGEIIQVKLNEKAIKWRISHDLYKDYKSGVRELFENEARACRQARKLYNAKPVIEVRIDSNIRNLSIQGIDSLGISEVVFDRVLRVLGVSGNVDGGNEVGQFGMGFASYTTISDVIKVDTWYRENNKDGSEQCYSFLGDNGIDFKILPKPMMDTYGTKITMTYNDVVDEFEIIEMIKNCALFCNVPVRLVIESEIEHKYDANTPVGVYDIDSYDSLEEYVDAKVQEEMIGMGVKTDDGKFNSKYSTAFYKKIHIDNDDIEFVGSIYYTKYSGEYNNNESLVKCKKQYNMNLLATVPIEMNINMSNGISSYVLNIKNERKFMPTADRDRLTRDAEVLIQKVLDDCMKKEFAEARLDSINDYINSEDKVFYDNYHYYEDYISTDRYESIGEVINTLCRVYDTTGGQRNSLKDMMKESDTLIRLQSLRLEYMERLKKVFPNAVFFRCKKVNDFPLLDEAGVISGEEYIKKYKLKPLTRQQKIKGEAIVYANKPTRIYNSGYRTHHANKDGDRLYGQAKRYGKAFISTTVGDVNDNIHDKMIMYDKVDKGGKNFKVLLDMMWNTESPYVFVKNIKGLNSESIQKYSDWVHKIVHEQEFNTATGKKVRVGDLIQKPNPTSIMGDIESVIALGSAKKIPAKFNNTLVVKNNAEWFELECALVAIGKRLDREYGVTMDSLLQYCGDMENINLYCNDSQKRIIYSRIPAYKIKCSKNLFSLMMRAIVDKPYEMEEILGLVDDINEVTSKKK